VSRLLKECGHEVLVANARKTRLIYAEGRKTDRIDAEKLARLARLDPKLLAPIEHRDESSQRRTWP
jgi:transposase